MQDQFLHVEVKLGEEQWLFDQHAEVDSRQGRVVGKQLMGVNQTRKHLELSENDQ
jgi:hypothetical protein